MRPILRRSQIAKTGFRDPIEQGPNSPLESRERNLGSEELYLAAKTVAAHDLGDQDSAPSCARHHQNDLRAARFMIAHPKLTSMGQRHMTRNRKPNSAATLLG